MRNEADYEAKRQRLAREREQGLAFSQTLREKLEATRIHIEDLEADEDLGGEDKESER